MGDSSSIPGLGRSPGGTHGNPLQYSCLDNPHGQRSLADYSPWSHKEWDTTERLSMHTRVQEAPGQRGHKTRCGHGGRLSEPFVGLICPGRNSLETRLKTQQKGQNVEDPGCLNLHFIH